MKFKTKFNEAEPFQVKLENKQSLNLKNTENKQFLTSKDKNILKILENRKILGSNFEDFEFDSEKDQLGRFSK